MAYVTFIGLRKNCFASKTDTNFMNALLTSLVWEQRSWGREREIDSEHVAQTTRHWSTLCQRMWSDSPKSTGVSLLPRIRPTWVETNVHWLDLYKQYSQITAMTEDGDLTGEYRIQKLDPSGRIVKAPLNQERNCRAMRGYRTESRWRSWQL